MKWPDWFGIKARAEADLYKQKYDGYRDAAGVDRMQMEETNLRLIAQLREMDQAFFTLSQVAPNWDQMRPVVKKTMVQVEKRMATENNRIRNLMVGEIKQAYNEPPKLVGRHEGVPIFEVPSIEDKSK